MKEHNIGVTVYLSGPMTGYPEFNYPAFQHACTWLRAMGFTVESPHENPKPEEELDGQQLWEYYMVLCRAQVAKCDRIFFLHGWPESRGARQEFQWAIEMGLEVAFLEKPIAGPTYRIIYMSERNIG